MNSSFNEQFGMHGAWRRSFAQRLHDLRDWLASHDLLDTSVSDRLEHLGNQARSDKVTVAFVAEFSRGKSELINAIFFAHYGRRLMPASAGRTTMCPTELALDPGRPASLRLLPIETRDSLDSLAQWRVRGEAWQQLSLDIGNAQQIAQALQQISETRRVSIAQAREWGFWQDDDEGANPLIDDQGLVEVPRWRHALVNMPHPLLKQGLVILDTPGLNAIGAEPELTVNLLPQAQAAVFVLAADTGVTKSDMAIWKEHLLPPDANALASARLVVLNKIDTLWDSLDSKQQIQAQLQRQRLESARMLGLSPEHVLPISAQKGLMAKVQKNDELLQASGIPAFEKLLADEIMGQRQRVLGAAIAAGARQLQLEVERSINLRRRDIDDQIIELRSLRGKNSSVISHMRGRIESEQKDFGASASKIHAIRSVNLRLLQELFQLLGSRTLKQELLELNESLERNGLKLGMRRIYGQTFERLHAITRQALKQAEEIRSMLMATYKELNAEYGFSLQGPAALNLSEFSNDLRAIEANYQQYLGISQVVRLSSAKYSQRLIKALAMRLRTAFESAANEVDLWNKSATAQLDAQLKERKRSFSRRLEAIDRIQNATTGLVDRIAEIEHSEAQLTTIQTQLGRKIVNLLPARSDAGTEQLVIL